VNELSIIATILVGISLIFNGTILKILMDNSKQLGKYGNQTDTNTADLKRIKQQCPLCTQEQNARQIR